MSIKGLVVAVIIAGFVSAAASARAEETPYGGKGAYASIGGVYGFAEGVNGYDGSGGYDLRGGYRIIDMFAVEGEWQHLTNFNATKSDGFDLEAYALTLNGKFYPITGRFQPYALLGAGWSHSQADTVPFSYHSNSFALRFGLGLAFYCTQRLGVSLEAGYLLPVTHNSGSYDFDVVPLTGSFFYHFN